MKKGTFCAPVKKVCVPQLMQVDLELAAQQQPQQSTGFRTPVAGAITGPNLTISKEAVGPISNNLSQPKAAGHNVCLPNLTEHHNHVPSRSKDSGHKKPPKKPASNFMIFINEYRASFIKKGLSPEEASDKAVKLWNSSSPAVKNKYQSKYEKLKAEYDIRMTKYREGINGKDKMKGGKGGKGKILKFKFLTQSFFQVRRTSRRRSLLRHLVCQLIIMYVLMQLCPIAVQAFKYQAQAWMGQLLRF